MSVFPANHRSVDAERRHANGFKLSGAAADDHSGFSVASAGDVNGDGFADLIVGAYGADPHGGYSGRELRGVRQGLGLCRQHRPVDARRHQRLQAQRRGGGRQQRPLGRLGRRRQRRRLRRPDRRRPWRRPARHQFRRELCGVRQGRRALPPTSTSRRLDGANGFKLSGAAADDHSGCSVASAGDVNGDGFADLIVGAPAPTRTAADSGASYVVFGKASGFAANIDLSDASTAATASSSAAWRRTTAAASRSPRRATSTATASPT